MLLLWLVAVCLVLIGAGLGRKAPVPDAVLWCALGFAAAFLPQYRNLTIDPRLTLFVFLPPLVYSSAVRLPWPEFRDNLRPISLLAIGLVLANTAVVAALARYVIGLPWPIAAALGALISPTDPVAASAVATRVGLPNRVVSILEGEGLVNDAVALTVVRLAIGAVATGEVSVAGGAARFFAILIGEPLYGCLLAAAIMALRRRIEDPRIEITVSLLTPFAAYLPPESLGGSGILATVAAGMYIGERLSTMVPAGTRLRSTSVWEIVVFLLNGLLFLMAGMQLRRVLQPEYLNRRYLEWGLLVTAAVVVVRAAWCGLAWALFRGRSLLREERDRRMPARHMAVISWCGMRGPISLAAALSTPVLASGMRLPHFETLLFLSAIVIVLTLVVEGVGLPYLVHALGLQRDARREDDEESRQLAFGASEGAAAALERLSRMESEGRVPAPVAGGLRRYYREQRDHEAAVSAAIEIRRALIDAQRERIQQLRGQSRLNDRVVQELERRLDLEESAIGD